MVARQWSEPEFGHQGNRPGATHLPKVCGEHSGISRTRSDCLHPYIQDDSLSSSDGSGDPTSALQQRSYGHTQRVVSRAELPVKSGEFDDEASCHGEDHRIGVAVELASCLTYRPRAGGTSASRSGTARRSRGCLLWKVSSARPRDSVNFRTS